jgi:hypothetical protein
MTTFCTTELIPLASELLRNLETASNQRTWMNPPGTLQFVRGFTAIPAVGGKSCRVWLDFVVDNLSSPIIEYVPAFEEIQDVTAVAIADILGNGHNLLYDRIPKDLQRICIEHVKNASARMKGSHFSISQKYLRDYNLPQFLRLNKTYTHSTFKTWQLLTFVWRISKFEPMTVKERIMWLLEKNMMQIQLYNSERVSFVAPVVSSPLPPALNMESTVEDDIGAIEVISVTKTRQSCLLCGVVLSGEVAKSPFCKHDCNLHNKCFQEYCKQQKDLMVCPKVGCSIVLIASTMEIMNLGDAVNEELVSNTEKECILLE